MIRRSFTLIEAVISMLIVSTTLAASLAVLAGARGGERITTDRTRGRLLAQDLMSEILAMPYYDPESDPSAADVPIQMDAGELDGSRASFDDVDDYDGWSASPPQYKDGADIGKLEGWERSVVVAWVSHGSVDGGSVALESGTKRVIVTVTCDGREVARLLAIRTNAWPAAAEGAAWE